MSASVVFMPNLGVATARQIIASPDLHDDAAVLDACELLMRRGDWMEAERARLLHEALRREGVEQIKRENLRQMRWRRAKPLLAVFLVLALVASTVLSTLH